MQTVLSNLPEAYYNKDEKFFSLKVKNRVHWICEKATGEDILDVGCSQGDISILLGREAKKVLGIDMSGESLEYAVKQLDKETDITQKYINFKKANFIDVNLGEQIFDIIILGDMLDSVTDPQRFINKAASHLIEGGKVIITVPFGLSDNADQRKVYYLTELLEIAQEGFEVHELEYQDNWIGMVLKKNSESPASIKLNVELIKQLESAFYSYEIKNANDIHFLLNKLEKHEENIRETNEYHNALKKKDDEISGFKSQVKELQKQNKLLTQSNEQLMKKLKNAEKNSGEKADEKLYQKKLVEEKEKLVISMKEKIKTKQLLFDAYKKEAALLKSYEQLLKRYEALRTSKLGKLTTSYWKMRKRYSKKK